MISLATETVTTVTLSGGDWVKIIIFGLGQLAALVGCLWKFNSRLVKLEVIMESLVKAETRREGHETRIAHLESIMLDRTNNRY